MLPPPEIVIIAIIFVTVIWLIQKAGAKVGGWDTLFATYPAKKYRSGIQISPEQVFLYTGQRPPLNVLKDSTLGILEIRKNRTAYGVNSWIGEEGIWMQVRLCFPYTHKLGFINYNELDSLIIEKNVFGEEGLMINFQRNNVYASIRYRVSDLKKYSKELKQIIHLKKFVE